MGLQISYTSNVELLFSFPLTEDVFEYEIFCKGEMDKKKRDGTYRVFPRVDRKAMQFPYARDRITDSDITVWCSNDYLGMSRHPKVRKEGTLLP